eukprot:NODE_2675_length_1065_cov_6.449803_g2230_i0.p1 GENE.NODE_2675_length_1065_cov_6.449803_g2230_i0~~NODE_2675_length_1065_cov_6.449803_g2230_i0.p1  ORF type:complete len:335 (-),score=39.12 NODE_2675_length_1065_cov_6.449803_g2230_i0:61-1065(-)
MVSATYSGTDPFYQRCLAALEKRLHVRDWPVILKALYLLHKLIQHGAPAFLRVLAARKSLLILPHKNIAESPLARKQQRFAFNYAAYLQEAVATFEASEIRLTGTEPAIPVGNDDDASEDQSAAALLLLRQVLQILTCLAACSFDSDYADCQVSLEIFRLLLADSRNLFLRASHILVGLLDNGSLLQPALASQAAPAIRRYSDVTTSINKLYTAVRPHFGVVPTLKEISVESLTRSLTSVGPDEIDTGSPDLPAPSPSHSEAHSDGLYVVEKLPPNLVPSRGGWQLHPPPALAAPARNEEPGRRAGTQPTSSCAPSSSPPATLSAPTLDELLGI